MTYSKVSQRNGVKHFKVHNNYLALLDKSDILFLNDQNLDRQSEGFFFAGSKFYFLSDKGTIIIDLSTNKKYFSELELWNSTLENNSFIKGFDYAKDEYSNYWSARLMICQFDPPNKLYELPNRYTYGNNFRKGDLNYVSFLSHIMCFSLLSGEYRWEIDTVKELMIPNQSEFSIIQLLGIFGSNLWLSYNVDRRSRLLALDTNTGQITWKSPDNLPSDAYNIKKIEDRKNLFSLFGVYDRSNPVSPYVEIDGRDGTILRQGIVESLFEEKLIVTKWLFQENRIYFTARREMLTSNYIGVLDYDSLELLWYSDVPGRRGDLKDLQVSQNKLYVLDAAGTLHIFEETDDTGSESEPVKIEIKQEIPKTSRFASSVFNLHVSDIPFFHDYPFGVVSIELTGSYAQAIPPILAAIEILTGETIEILEYQPQKDELYISCRIMNTALTFDTTSNQLSIPQAILESVNEVLVNHGSLKKLKEFEPMPPDDFIILTYVTEEMYHRYGKAGYGLWEEYNWDSGEKEWAGVW